MLTDIQPTEEARTEAARQAAAAQAEFRRGLLAQRDTIRAEIQRLNDVFTREIEPVVSGLVARDFASNPERAAADLKEAVMAFIGPADHLVSVTGQNTPVIEQTGRYMQANIAGLHGAMEQCGRILASSKQSERDRLERAEAYRLGVVAAEELHQRRLAGEDV